jgi:hypothetical protein
VVGVGFDASYPDLLLAGLLRRGHLVYGFKCDGPFVGFGERWVTDQPFIKMDWINQMLSWLNCNVVGLFFVNSSGPLERTNLFPLAVVTSNEIAW